MSFGEFLQDESGAVTVDWVFMTAGVVVLAVLVTLLIQAAVVDKAIYIGDKITEYSKFLE